MEGGGCKHEELEFIGRQRAEKGYNEYFRCKRCGAVLIFTPEGPVYKVGGEN